MASQSTDLLFDLILDPTMLDLVLAMPDLTWREIATTAVTLLMWDIVSKPLSSSAPISTRRSGASMPRTGASTSARATE